MKRKSKIMNISEAIAQVKDGDVVMVGGFGVKGRPKQLVEELAKSGKKNLTIISNDLENPNEGLGKLLNNNQIKMLIGTYYNWNPEVVDAYNFGEIEVKLVPQGTFAESIRAGGVGIPAYYTSTSAGTTLADGKEVRIFNGRECVLEEALTADIALVKAQVSDELGNLTYSKVCRNFNPAMAMAAKITIAEVDEFVEAGKIKPEEIITQHIFVDSIVIAKGGNQND